MVEGLITQGQQHTMSHLGLGEESTFLQALKDAGMIGAKSWGLNSGSQSHVSPRRGSLVLGGYDKSSIEGPTYDYPIAKPNLVNNRPCPLQVYVTRMNIHVQNGNKTDQKEIVTAANKVKVCIEP